MARKSFIVYLRTAGKKAGTYYAGFIQPDGSYRRVALTDRFGAAITRKGQAEDTAREMWQKGAGGAASQLLATYLESFWEEGSQYQRMREMMGKPLSAKYIKTARSSLKIYVLPWIQKSYPTLHLYDLKAAHLQELLMSIQAGGDLGPSRINGIMKAVRIALSEAERLELIPANPARKVREIPMVAPRRKILEMEEASALFALPWGDKWGLRYMFANMLAALAGMRLGEIRGLRAEDIHEGYLHVCHNFQDDDGLKGPKHSSQVNVRWRDIPVPSMLQTALSGLAAANPNGDGYVFWGQKPGIPLSSVGIEVAFKEALEEIGIEEEERLERKLTFHSWRHWYNTHMRPLLPEYQLQMLTGHRSTEMTDRYTEITEAQRAAVAQVAERLLPLEEAEKIGTPAASDEKEAGTDQISDSTQQHP